MIQRAVSRVVNPRPAAAPSTMPTSVIVPTTRDHERGRCPASSRTRCSSRGRTCRRASLPGRPATASRWIPGCRALKRTSGSSHAPMGTLAGARPGPSTPVRTTPVRTAAGRTQVEPIRRRRAARIQRLSVAAIILPARPLGVVGPRHGRRRESSDCQSPGPNVDQSPAPVTCAWRPRVGSAAGHPPVPSRSFAGTANPPRERHRTPVARRSRPSPATRRAQRYHAGASRPGCRTIRPPASATVPT
jgi:hypothetical protein